MVSDHDLEAVLRRYQVPGPSAALSRAIVDGAALTPSRSREWVWGPLAAAAVVAVWLVAQTRSQPALSDPIREIEVTMVAEVLGGGEDAIERAELTVPRRPDRGSEARVVEEPWQEP